VYLITQAVGYLTWATVDPDPKVSGPVLTIIYPPAVVVAIAIAMLRYGLYDVRPVVHRVAVYGLLAVGLTAGFAAVYLVVLSGLSLQLAGGPYSWLIVVAALVVVLLADPVRRQMRLRLERRFLGERGEPLRVLARLDRMVTTDRSEAATVFAAIAETVMEAMRSPGAAVLLYRAGVLERVGLAGDRVDHPLVLPLVHRGERLGELRVATRTPGEAYGRRDRELLNQIAGQTAAISYGLRRDHDIDHIRRMALEGMAEQRTRLGRDLHDGLAPLLAGAGLTAEALRRGMPEGSPDAEEAALLASRLRNAATEVRRIAHDLQPTGTVDAGLSGLIRDHVASLTGPGIPSFTVDLDDLDKTLPATLELAVSRVALEAITNVVRHAHAIHAHVSLRIVDGGLELLVADDGVGISQPYVSGLGITSMRARVEALGGTFNIAAATGGGTRLTARVPVPT
jgi:two-component system, NarL family, sensor kinase